MAELQDPSNLSEVERYKQLNGLLKGSGKSSNPDWFAEPSELAIQLHLTHTEGKSLDCAVFVAPENRWVFLASQPLASLTSPARLTELVDSLGSHSDLPKVSSLGVIIHAGNDFATTEVPLDKGLPTDLDRLRTALIYEPTATLQDSSLAESEFAWRLLPYPSAESPPFATAMVVSRPFDIIANNLANLAEERGMPIRVSIQSVPLDYLQALPLLMEFREGHPCAVIVPFAAFTMLACLTGDGELRLVRSLQGRINPSLIVQSIRTTMISLEIKEFDIQIIFPEQPNQMLLRALKKQFTNTRIATVDSHSLATGEATGGAPLLMAASTRTLPVRSATLANSESFKRLAVPRWGRANFCVPAAQIAGFEPSSEELKLVKRAKQLRPLMILLPLLVCGFIGFWIFQTIRSEKWNHNEDEAGEIRREMKTLKEQNEKHSRYESLLQDRSRAWSNLEFIAGLLPEDAEAYLDKVNYSVSSSEESKSGIGFVRIWIITGYYDQSAQQEVSRLGSYQYMQEVFKRVYETTSDESFNLSPSTRQLQNLRISEEENPQRNFTGSNQDEFNPASLPRKFRLEMTQRFDPKDPLALPPD